MKIKRFQNSKFHNLDPKRGFTIVELIVAIGLFIVVSLVSLGSLLSIVDVNKKTQSIKSVINNLNFAVESMSKSMRVGSTYHCADGPAVPFNFDQPNDCQTGGSLIAFEKSSGDPNISGDQIIYRLNGNQIERSVDGGSTFLGVTAPEVVMTSNTGLRFFVFGSSVGDSDQAKVVIVLRGKVSLSNKGTTDFNIQTTVSKRGVDR
jgi:type II secretory pathway pseudopilin PulG